MKGPHKVYYGNSGTEANEAAAHAERRDISVKARNSRRNRGKVSVSVLKT